MVSDLNNFLIYRKLNSVIVRLWQFSEKLISLSISNKERNVILQLLNNKNLLKTLYAQ